jgi:hypothetical protein
MIQLNEIVVSFTDASNSNTPKVRILVVDDEPDILLALSIILEGQENLSLYFKISIKRIHLA